MPNEKNDQSLGIDKPAQDELETSSQPDQTLPLVNADNPQEGAEPGTDTEELRDSKQPKRKERDRRIATD